MGNTPIPAPAISAARSTSASRIAMRLIGRTKTSARIWHQIRVTPDVKDGGIADSRAKMEAILAANPDKGSISAVWAAWDQPALGALQAIEAAGRSGEGIVITSIDANPEARAAIGKGSNFEATMAQNFRGIGTAVADAVKRKMGGEEMKQSVIYVPTRLITATHVSG